MKPFPAHIGEAYLVPGLRTRTVALAVSGSLGYLPSSRHRVLASRIPKGAGAGLFLPLHLPD